MVQHMKICQLNPPYKQTEKKTLVHLIRCQKSFQQNTKSLYDKGLGESWDTRNITKQIKSIYRKPTANIKPNGEKFTAIPLNSGKKECCPLSPYLLIEFLKPYLEQ